MKAHLHHAADVQDGAVVSVVVGTTITLRFLSVPLDEAFVPLPVSAHILGNRGKAVRTRRNNR